MLNRARKKFILWAMIAMIVLVVVLVAAVNIVSWYQSDQRLETAIEEITEYRLNTGQLGAPTDDMVILPVGIIDAEDGLGIADSTGESREDSGGENSSGEDYPEEDPDFEDFEDTPFSGMPDINGFMGPGLRGSALTQYGSRYFIAIIDTDNNVVRVEQQQELVSSSYAQELVNSLPEDYKKGGYVNDYKYSYMTSFDDKDAVCFLDCATEMHALRSLLLISVIIGVAGILLAFLFILRMSRIAVEPVRISIEKQKQFITNAGHELKTPLTSIATNMDILTMDLGKNEWVESTKKQVGRLRRLVENLVSLSKMEEDERTLLVQEFSLSGIVRECAETFSSVAEMSGKEIEADITDDLNIQGDPGTIQQLISILCDNAVKYSTGSGNIKIRLYDEGKNVCFETENEWEQNVDEEHLDDLFERFYRGDPSRSSENRSQGHGLGLSIAKAIAEKNNARLSVETRGSCIVFKVKFKK